MSLLLPNSRRAALEAAFREFRAEVATPLAAARSAKAVVAALDASQPQTTAFVNFAVSLVRDFDPAVLRDLVFKGFARSLTTPNLAHPWTSVVGLRLRECIDLYLASAKIPASSAWAASELCVGGRGAAQHPGGR